MKFDLVQNFVSKIAASRPFPHEALRQGSGTATSEVQHSFRGLAAGDKNFIEFHTTYIVRTPSEQNATDVFSLEATTVCVFSIDVPFTDTLARDPLFITPILQVAAPLAQQRARELLLAMGVSAELPVQAPEPIIYGESDKKTSPPALKSPKATKAPTARKRKSST